MSPKQISLMEKYLTPEVREELSSKKTSNDVTLDDVIRSGVEHPDSKVGMYAPDMESYKTFALLFDPVIAEYHNFKLDQKHKTDFDVTDRDIDNIDPDGTYILSTRIRCARNAKGFAFPGAITKEDRLRFEKMFESTVMALTSDLKGQYISLGSLSSAEKEEMEAQHLLFQQGDEYLDSAGINRDWPAGRGVFLTDTKDAGYWIQEEDMFRIWVLQKGSNIRNAFNKWQTMIQPLDKEIGFAYSDRYGYLTSCPTNVGTGMRASFMMKLPNLGKNEAELKEICANLGLAVRGIAGEHSKSSDGTFDISNKARLGISEAEIIELVAVGAKKLIALEKIAAEEAVA